MVVPACPINCALYASVAQKIALLASCVPIHLHASFRKPFTPKTTRSDHAASASSDLLALEGHPCAPATHLVSDITYIPTKEGWLYLAIVMDLFSRSIIGWSLSNSLHSEPVINAISHASERNLIKSGAIFHSDRGCQYTASSTRELLRSLGLRQSMSAKGYCYDNPFAESCFASLKSEILPNASHLVSKAAASIAIFDYLESFYNRSRLHSSFGLSFSSSFFNSILPKL